VSTLQASAQKQLRQLIEQIERLEEEKKGLAEDISDKFAEAKATGFDVKIIKQVLRLRKKSKTDREEEEAILATYMHALGMLADTPLGEYAINVHKVAVAHGMSKEVADMVIGDEIDKAKAHHNLKKMLKEDGATATVQFGDGPEIPL
jgi:uncharacterized protein (UPF0335 family)